MARSPITQLISQVLVTHYPPPTALQGFLQIKSDKGYGVSYPAMTTEDIEWKHED